MIARLDRLSVSQIEFRIVRGSLDVESLFNSSVFRVPPRKDGRVRVSEFGIFIPREMFLSPDVPLRTLENVHAFRERSESGLHKPVSIAFYRLSISFGFSACFSNFIGVANASFGIS